MQRITTHAHNEHDTLNPHWRPPLFWSLTPARVQQESDATDSRSDQPKFQIGFRWWTKESIPDYLPSRSGSSEKGNQAVCVPKYTGQDMTEPNEPKPKTTPSNAALKTTTPRELSSESSANAGARERACPAMNKRIGNGNNNNNNNNNTVREVCYRKSVLEIFTHRTRLVRARPNSRIPSIKRGDDKTFIE